MQREWESVLGSMVLFTVEDDGRWVWDCYETAVKADPKVKYPSLLAARLAAAALIFAFYVHEEATSEPVPAVLPGVKGPAVPPGHPAFRPPQGSGGR